MVNPDGTFIFYNFEEVEHRLSRQGLSVIIPWEAAKAGYDSLLENSVHAPPSGKGIGIWSAEMGRLRELLLPKGWEKCDKDFFSTVIHYDEEIAIVVMAGNDETGLKDGKPKSRSRKVNRTRKGVAIRHAIEVNKHFLAYQHNPLWFNEMGITERPLRTWVLLHNIGPNTSSFEDVRIELSLPVGLTDGYVSTWQERLLIARPLEMRASDKVVKPINVGTVSGNEIRVLRKKRNE